MNQHLGAVFAMVLAATIFSSTAKAGWDEGLDAHKRGDYTTALKELRLLSEQGDVYAPRSIGNMYDSGEGVTQDYKQAIKWYKLAASRGDDFAPYLLGIMYGIGEGVAKDKKQSVKWFLRGAVLGESLSLYILGGKYERGIGVPQDYRMAHMYYNLSGAMDYSTGKDARDRITVKMLPQQIFEAQEMARKWFSKHSNKITDAQERRRKWNSKYEN